jgi:broad specificity phosphatase PhoE
MGTPVPPRDVWLIRHGQSTSNAGVVTVGQADVPLTPLGTEQARAVADAVTRAPGLIVTSPFLRARATAGALVARWPSVPCETWPIQEITYLSPSRCAGTLAADRQPWIDAYWERADPFASDGPDAESFAAFIERIKAFHRALLARDDEFVVVIGHGQFFRAFLLELDEPLEPSADVMRTYRRNESRRPLANGEIVRLTAGRLTRARRGEGR